MTETRTYSVTGMSCGHCEKAVTQELAGITGIQDASAKASTGTLEITVTSPGDVSDEAVLAAVEEAGYSAARN